MSLDSLTSNTPTINGEKYAFKINNGRLQAIGSNAKSFARNDGTSFVLINIGVYKKLNKFICFTLLPTNEVIVAAIFSEVELDKVRPEYEQTIADGLLSNERLLRKIKQFNGYVGILAKTMVYIMIVLLKEKH